MRLFAALFIAPLLLTSQEGGIFTVGGSVAAPAVGGSAAGPAPQYPPGDLCSLEGSVVNSETGGPVNKATLALSRSDGRGAASAVSDASGRFAFTGIAPGRYRLMFSRSGFQSATFSASDSALDMIGRYSSVGAITLERGQRTSGLVFRVTPLGVVTGKVVDEDGDPVSYAHVQLSRFEHNGPRKRLAPAKSVSTNDLGEYRLFDIPPGKYVVSVSYGQMQRMMMERIDVSGGPVTRAVTVERPGGEFDYAPTFYPGTVDPASAGSVIVAPGAQMTAIDLRLMKSPMVTVKGRVAGAGMPERQAGGVSIALTRRDSVGIGSSTRGGSIDRQGNFQITGVTPGAYILTARMNQMGRASYSARTFLDVGSSNVEGVLLNIPPPAEVLGHVRFEGQDAPLPRNVRISLTWRDADSTFAMPTARVDPDGSFRFQNVSLDRYNVEVSGLPDGCYVKAIRAGAADALTAGLDLTGGAAGALEILVSPRAAQVTGLVADQQNRPVAGATVAVVPQDPARREQTGFYGSATTDETGRYTLRNVAPGDYRIFAWARLDEPGAYMDADFLKPVEDRGKSLTLRENDKAQIQLTAIP